MIEQSLVIIKPDAMERDLADIIADRITDAGFRIVARKNTQITLQQARDLYLSHKGKTFYNGLVNYMTESEVVVMVIEDENAVAGVRALIGPTDPREAPRGTLRGDYKPETILTADGIIRNVIHASDSTESAEREIAIFF